jgi:ADP-heptose:LPS heptosyltransferase
MRNAQIHRVIVHRLGSLGDFIVSLPCFHLIRNSFPNAEILLLTNSPVDNRAAPAISVLGNAGFIDRYLEYPVGTRNIAPLVQLCREIRSLAPDLVIYLVQRTDAISVWRDYVFFRAAGVNRLVGFPFRKELREYRRPQAGSDLWESEASRLARCMAPLGNARIDSPESWNLRLTQNEIAAADQLLATVSPPPMGFIAMSIGAKQAIKDWGDENWRHVLAGLRDPDLGLVLVGAAEEFDRSQEMAHHWPGPVVNACGLTTPRQSAALLHRVRLLLCHDSGPMHLAAAERTRCVAVFSTLGHKGEWFPFGDRHFIFYPERGASSIQSIAPEPVLSAARSALTEASPVGTPTC